MIGNYIYNPTDNQEIQPADREFFILGLLKDICEGSSNPFLNTQTQVSFEGDYNLSDLDNKKAILSFAYVPGDPSNATIKENKTSIKAVYEIGLIAKKDVTTIAELLQGIQEITSAITKNWNSETSISANYIAQVPSGKTISTPLTQNEAPGEPNISRYESKDQPNYLTCDNKYVIKLVKET